jgi:hypothetical protein
MNQPTLKELVERTADALSEHAESVHIFVTERAGGTSRGIDTGRGNFYAQLGQIVEFVTIQKQFQRNWAIRQDAKPENRERE